MQPRISEVKYVAERSLDALGKIVSELINKQDEHWEPFGDMKATDKEYIQTMVRVEFAPEPNAQMEAPILEK